MTHHHHHISLLLYTAEHRPLQLISCIQRLPAVLTRSAIHPAGGRLTLRFPIRGLHSSIVFPHRPFDIRAIWPAHCHFSLLIRWAMSTTFILLRISSFTIRSRTETPSIGLFVARWATLAFSKDLLYETTLCGTTQMTTIIIFICDCFSDLHNVVTRQYNNTGSVCQAFGLMNTR